MFKRFLNYSTSYMTKSYPVYFFIGAQVKIKLNVAILFISLLFKCE